MLAYHCVKLISFSKRKGNLEHGCLTLLLATNMKLEHSKRMWKGGADSRNLHGQITDQEGQRVG